MEAERVLFFFIGILLALGVGHMGSKRKIGFGWAFFLSIINLFIGLIVVLCSKKLSKDIKFVDAEDKKGMDA